LRLKVRIQRLVKENINQQATVHTVEPEIIEFAKFHVNQATDQARTEEAGKNVRASIG